MVLTTNDLIGTSRDGYNIYDRADSHFHGEGGLTKELLQKAFSKIYLNSRHFLRKEFDFHENIGCTTCVSTTPEDEVVMVYRKGRKGQTPMVKGREPEPCSTITFILRKEPDLPNHYTLITAYIGSGSPMEPWDKNIKSAKERQFCEEYWSTHALIYNSELIDWSRTA